MRKSSKSNDELEKPALVLTKAGFLLIGKEFYEKKRKNILSKNKSFVREERNLYEAQRGK